MKEQKTAEQILHKHFIPIDPFDNLQILQAIQEYSDQQNAELLAWKESAMCELNTLDLQSLGAKLGIGLGQSVSENIHAKIDGLLERVKELEVALQDLVDWQNKEVKKRISFSDTMANARRLLK